jgi:hydrogenase-1 operon protein HyaE
MDFSPLTTSIIEREQIAILNEDNMDDFLAENGDVILMICGDHQRLMEVNDAAVILPELVKASNGLLTPAVVERGFERDVQRRYRFSSFPSFVFLRDGGYLGSLSRVLDWSDYITEINAILAKEPSEPPAFKIRGFETPAKTETGATNGAAVTPKPEKSMTDRLIEEGADNV